MPAPGVLMWAKLLVVGLLVALNGSAVAASPPPPLALEAGELEQLDAGSVIIRSPDAGGLTIGIVDIPATSEQVWATLLDFPARVESVGVLESIDLYAPESDPKGLGASFHLRVLGTDVRYHLRYDIDRAANFCAFALDPEREHDITEASGSYHVLPLPNGQHRVVYRSKTETGRFVPGFVKKMLTNESLRSQLEDMRTRAPTK